MNNIRGSWVQLEEHRILLKAEREQRFIDGVSRKDLEELSEIINFLSVLIRERKWK